MKTGIVTRLARGYRVAPISYFENELDAALSSLANDRLGGLLPTSLSIPKSPRAVMEKLGGAIGAIWPPEGGPPFRLAGDRVLVDLWAASNQLANRL